MLTPSYFFTFCSFPHTLLCALLPPSLLKAFFSTSICNLRVIKSNNIVCGHRFTVYLQAFYRLHHSLLKPLWFCFCCFWDTKRSFLVLTLPLELRCSLPGRPCPPVLNPRAPSILVFISFFFSLTLSDSHPLPRLYSIYSRSYICVFTSSF